jgi:hypothetical protein
MARCAGLTEVAAMLKVAVTSVIKPCPLFLFHRFIRKEQFAFLAQFRLTFTLARFSVVLGSAPQYLIINV